MASLPLEATVEIVELPNGYRVDLTLTHVASEEKRRLAPVHWPTLEAARAYAWLIEARSGAKVVERLRCAR